MTIPQSWSSHETYTEKLEILSESSIANSLVMLRERNITDSYLLLCEVQLNL
jgi:hypothetical protein